MTGKYLSLRTTPLRHKLLALPVAAVFGMLVFVSGAPRAGMSVSRGGPPLATYDELVRFYEHENLPEPLRSKLEILLTTPFVSNEAAARGVRPLKPRSDQLGAFLRVVCWNIERGLEWQAVAAALSGDTAKFDLSLDKAKYPPGSRERGRVLGQVALLKAADVIVLNEVDWGVRRTDYRNVVEELASALKMNYAYGVEFVEIDPIQLGVEKFAEAREEDRAELLRHIKVDAARYKGLHGTAILSRYRLENVRLVPFKHQGHDWYTDEKNGVARLEAGKRTVSEKVFLEKVTREVRRGGRMMLLAEIADADIPTGRATIVATHLESRAKPKERVQQLEELLAHIGKIAQPVILAGDMNTSTRDMTPTSIKREIKKRLGSEKFWIERGIKYATGVGLVLDFVRGGINFSRTHADPTVRSIKFIAENPEAGFFETLKDFRFADGGAFDFRGDEKRSTGGHTETLANSNERARKGFATTYAATRTIGPTGKYKLDWIFVKPAGAEKQSYRFAPHFGRTLEEVNYSIEDRISDHNPIMVDLPFSEPKID